MESREGTSPYSPIDAIGGPALSVEGGEASVFPFLVADSVCIVFVECLGNWVEGGGVMVPEDEDFGFMSVVLVPSPGLDNGLVSLWRTVGSGIGVHGVVTSGMMDFATYYVESSKKGSYKEC